MARQDGYITINGTLGKLTFFRSKDGHLVRQKGGISAQRIASDPAFQRTRENGAEFGRAGKAGKLLRNAIRSLILNAADSRMVSRLTREMLKVIQADTTNPRGLRNVISGDPALLQHFEFNINGKMSTTMFAPFNASIDRVTGQCLVNIQPFIPLNMIAAPAGTTHFRFTSAGVEVDFEQQNYVVQTLNSADLPWNAVATAEIDLLNTVTPNSTHPLFLAFGIEFYQEVNGVLYSLKNGAFNALSIVAVEGQ